LGKPTNPPKSNSPNRPSSGSSSICKSGMMTIRHCLSRKGKSRYGSTPSPVKVTLPLSFCYTPGLLHRLSAGGHHAGQSVRTFCGEKSHFCDGAWHTGTRPGSGATRYVVCPDRPEAVHPHCVVFDRL